MDLESLSGFIKPVVTQNISKNANNKNKKFGFCFFDIHFVFLIFILFVSYTSLPRFHDNKLFMQEIKQ